MFQIPSRIEERGLIKLSTFMKPYKVGEYVDIKANAAQQKGMPHKFYQGYVPAVTNLHIHPSSSPETDVSVSRTGIIYNVTPRAVGVLINKRVGNRFIQKRVNLRVEHVRHSQGRQVFLDRVKENVVLRAEAKQKGGRCFDFFKIFDGQLMLFSTTESVYLRRKQALPREAYTVEAASGKNLPQTLNPVPYETTI